MAITASIAHYTFADPRLAKTDSPSLWQSRSGEQLYLAGLLTADMSEGPALTMSVGVPDKHFFRGSYGGKDIIPLYRDRAATQANMTVGLSDVLAVQLGIDPPAVEDVAAYCYALLSPSAYQKRFAEELRTPGLRVPMTADADLWAEAVDQGRHLLWLHSFAERFRDPDAERPAPRATARGSGLDRAGPHPSRHSRRNCV